MRLVSSALVVLALTAGTAAKAQFDKACEADCTQRNNFCVHQLNAKADQYYATHGKAIPANENDNMGCLNSLQQCMTRCLIKK